MKIADAVVNILGARHAGCPYIVAVTTGAAAKEKRAQHQPTHRIHHLNEIVSIVSKRLQPAVQ